MKSYRKMAHELAVQEGRNRELETRLQGREESFAVLDERYTREQACFSRMIFSAMGDQGERIVRQIANISAFERSHRIVIPIDRSYGDRTEFKFG